MTTYETSIGTIGDGDRLHVMYGHKTDRGMVWSPVCELDRDADGRAVPLYAPDISRVTCKRCQATFQAILRERRKG